MYDSLDRWHTVTQAKGCDRCGKEWWTCDCDSPTLNLEELEREYIARPQ